MIVFPPIFWGGHKNNLRLQYRSFFNEPIGIDELIKWANRSNYQVKVKSLVIEAAKITIIISFKTKNKLVIRSITIKEEAQNVMLWLLQCILQNILEIRRRFRKYKSLLWSVTTIWASWKVLLWAGIIRWDVQYLEVC